jgi:outer membrane receptor protein involved in Fe transport
MDGFELAAGGKLNYGFHWSADTTYTNVTDKAFGDYNLIAHQIDYATTTPKYRGNLAFGWADSHWSADGFIHYTTQYATYVGDGAKVVSSPSYATLGGRVAYVLPLAITAALSGQNLTTAHQIEAGPMDLRAPRRVLISLSKTW